MNKQDFANKMDWEGGIYALADYGLKPEDIKDKQLRKLWTQFMEQFEKCDTIACDIMDILPDPGEE